MSNKNRVKDRLANGKIRPLYLYGPGAYTTDHWYEKHGYTDLGKNPSWFNKTHNNRPKRKEARALCRGIVAGRKDAEATMFPLEMKPCAYFW